MNTHRTSAYNTNTRWHSAVFRGFAAFWAIIVCAFAASAFAQDGRNVLQSIDTSVQQGGKIIVRVNFKEPLRAVPANFAVTNPARIAFDVPNTANGLPKSTVDVGEGDVRSISVVEATNRTRMVVNLSRPLSYTTALEGNTLVLTVEAALQGVLKESQQTAKFAEPAAVVGVQKQSIRDVDFRRGTNGEGRVVVDLSSPNTGIDIR
jgi:type IV pilus assembly protein PilQ